MLVCRKPGARCCLLHAPRGDNLLPLRQICSADLKTLEFPLASRAPTERVSHFHRARSLNTTPTTLEVGHDGLVKVAIDTLLLGDRFLKSLVFTIGNRLRTQACTS